MESTAPAEGAMAPGISADEESNLWNQIDDAERHLVSGRFDQAASIAYSTTQSIRAASLKNIVDQSSLAEMIEAVGMISVQSMRELGRTSHLFIQLKKIYGSVGSIPVQVFLAGASMQIAEGFGSDLGAIFQEYLAKWRYVDGQGYCLAEVAKDRISPCVMSNKDYLKVAELYTVTILGTLSRNAEIAISWTEAAELADEDRQDLLRKLQALQSSTNQKSSAANGQSLRMDRNLSASTTVSAQPLLEDSSKAVKPHYMPQAEKLKERSLKYIHPIDRMDLAFWWFHSVRVKFGKLHFTLPSGKLMFFFSLLFSTIYILRKRSADFKRIAIGQALSLRRVLLDTWRLAFSVQTNPLAAVQQLPPAAPRGSW